jgi:hypothetical protein
MKTTAIIIASVFAIGCGSDKDGKGSSAGAEAGPLKSFMVTDEAALPPCTEATAGSLAYASKETKFYACEETKWAAVEIAGANGANGKDGTNGKDGMSIASIWRYHLDTLSGGPELASESAGSTNIKLGTIQLAQFSDGSALITTIGNTFYSATTSPDDFSHTFLMRASKEEQEYISKINIYANSRIRYKVTLGDKPVFKVVVDTDGNFANNSDITLTLEKQ